jgi:hypothetical protein
MNIVRRELRDGPDNLTNPVTNVPSEFDKTNQIDLNVIYQSPLLLRYMLGGGGNSPIATTFQFHCLTNIEGCMLIFSK